MQFTHEREFIYSRNYHGPTRTVIFDWAGTTMDFGGMGPAVVFQKVFEEKGVTISMEEARIPMGAHKKVHIGLITEIPSVRRRWADTLDAEPTSKDVDEMFERFVPLQEACLSEYSTLIPGTLEVIAECRKCGYKIGSTSGYLPGMLAINQADAEKQGYVPDATFGAGDVPRGRPFGHMVLRNILELDVSPVQSVVKVDDTLTGIEEGLHYLVGPYSRKPGECRGERAFAKSPKRRPITCRDDQISRGRHRSRTRPRRRRSCAGTI